MIEELLDAARVQAGQALDLQLEPVDLGELLRDLARARTTGAGNDPRVLVDAPPGLIVDGDRARLERALENVVDNAIKYSAESAPVHVVARLHADKIAVSVLDEGVGIPADELPQLFMPFYRASTARGTPGIGLGLAGARAIVEHHGGQITVESILGEGTTVTITLYRANRTARL
jgi:signal transduction histidine kinase